MGEKARSYRWVILALTWLTAFILYSSMTQLAPLAKTIMKEMGITGAMYSLLYTAPLFALALLVFLAGAISDRFGPRRVVSFGMTLVAVCCIGRSFAMSSGSYGALILLNFVFGIGFGFILPNLPKLTREWFPASQRGLAASIYTTGINFGSAAGIMMTFPIIMPLAGGNWAKVPMVWGIGGAVLCILIWLFLRNGPDYVSSAAAAIDNGEKPPLINFGVFSNKSLVLLGATLFCTTWCFYALTSWWTVILTSRGVSPGLAAACTGLLPISGLLASGLTPAVSQYFKRRTVFMWGSILLGAVCMAALFFVPVGSVYMILVFLVGIGVNVPFVLGVFVMPGDIVPKEMVATATGLVMTMGYIAAVVGNYIVGWIWDVTNNATNIMLLVTALLIIGTLISSRIPDPFKTKKDVGAAADIGKAE